MSTNSNREMTIGFLLLEEALQIGFCGGYLVLNALGRPLEFHCAAPIRPNRGQQILFGASLKPYLLNEVIGPALLAKSSAPPRILVVADPHGWSLAERVAAPLVWVGSLAGDEAETESVAETESNLAPHGAVAPHTLASPWQPLQLSQQSVWLATASIDGAKGESANSVRQLLAPLASRFSLDEPFERIRQALAEAHAMAESQTRLAAA